MTNPTNLCERLRDADINSVQRCSGSRIFGEAADEIERQAAEVKRLRTLLEAAQNFIGWSSTRHQIICGVNAGDLYDEIAKALNSGEQK